MALIKCHECGHQISKSAAACPNCGAKPKKRTSIVTWVLALVFAVPVFLVAVGPGREPTAASQPIVAPPARPQGWQYSQPVDSMTGKAGKQASLQSANALSLSFPYQGTQRATLTLREHPRFGKDVIVRIERGQIQCGLRGCTVPVRFDDGLVIEYKAAPPEDNNSTVLFIRDYAGFVGKAKASSVVRVELQLFQAGNHTMEFPTAGLQW